MNSKQAETAFKNLKLIIYQKKYLIPQTPKKLYFFGSKVAWELKQKILKEKHSAIEKSNGIKKGQAIFKMINKIKESDPSVNDLWKKQKQANLRDLQQYKKKYLQPPNIFRAYTPYRYYLKKFFLQNKIKHRATVKEASLKWQQMPQKEKQELAQQCENEKIKYYPTYIQYICNHYIPKIQNEDILQKTGQKKAIEKEIPIDDEENYEDVQEEDQFGDDFSNEAEQLPALIKDQSLELFLQKWGVTPNQLQYIRKVCTQYQKAKKSNKNLKKIIEQITKDEENDNNS